MATNPLLIVGLVLAGLVAFCGLYAWSTYNGLVDDEIEINTARSNVDTQLQKRADVIPALVSTTQTSLDFQLRLVKDYAQAREGLMQANADYEEAMANNDTDGAVKALAAAQKNFNNINTMLEVQARTESVPQADLSSVKQLNNEISSLSNSVSYKWEQYNIKVEDFNKRCSRFPSSMIASHYGFEKKEFFKAQPGAENMPSTNMTLAV